MQSFHEKRERDEKKAVKIILVCCAFNFSPVVFIRIVFFYVEHYQTVLFYCIPVELIIIELSSPLIITKLMNDWNLLLHFQFHFICLFFKSLENVYDGVDEKKKDCK